MHPILFEVGGFTVYTYGALGALAFLFVAAVALSRGRALGVSSQRTTDLIFYTSLLSLFGARALFLLQNPQHMHSLADLINLRDGGLVFYGALLVGLPAGSLLMKRYKMPFYAMWDVFATAMPIAHGVSRLGCFAAGCCYGLPSSLPWAVRFDDALSVAPRGVYLHPTQLYEALYLFGLGAVLNLFYRRKSFDGQVMLLYLMLYALGRATIEVFRGDAARGYFLESLLGSLLSYSQGVSLLVGLGALVLLVLGTRRAAARQAVAAQIEGPRAE